MEKSYPLFLKQLNNDQSNTKRFHHFFTGESYLDCCERILNTLVCIESLQDETYLIVAHQGLLRCVIGYLLHVEVKQKTFTIVK
jgi:broad specificity phosphatase PhoE